MHRRIAAEQVVGNVLELGAGGLNHVNYETTCARYDVVEPIADIVLNSPSYGQVDQYLGGYDEFVELAFTGELTYQKILSVAVLEHLTHLPWIVAASALALAVPPRDIAAWLFVAGKRRALDGIRKAKGEAQNESAPVDVKSLLP